MNSFFNYTPTKFFLYVWNLKTTFTIQLATLDYRTTPFLAAAPRLAYSKTTDANWHCCEVSHPTKQRCWNRPKRCVPKTLVSLHAFYLETNGLATFHLKKKKEKFQKKEQKIFLICTSKIISNINIKKFYREKYQKKKIGHDLHFERTTFNRAVVPDRYHVWLRDNAMAQVRSSSYVCPHTSIIQHFPTSPV